MRPSEAECNQVLYIPLSSVVWSETEWAVGVWAPPDWRASERTGPPPSVNHNQPIGTRGGKKKSHLWPHRSGYPRTALSTGQKRFFIYLLIYFYLLLQKGTQWWYLWFRLSALDGAFNQWLSTHEYKAYTRTALWQKYCWKIFSEVKTNEETNDPRSALTWLFFFLLIGCLVMRACHLYTTKTMWLINTVSHFPGASL